MANGLMDIHLCSGQGMAAECGVATHMESAIRKRERRKLVLGFLVLFFSPFYSVACVTVPPRFRVGLPSSAQPLCITIMDIPIHVFPRCFVLVWVFILFCVFGEVFLCVSVHHMHTVPPGGRGRVLTPLGLELQKVVSSQVGAGN